MTDLIRKGEGQPLRDAMKRSGLTQAELAAKTKAADPSGKGVSLGTIVKVTGSGKFASNRCRLRTAELITAVLGEPVEDHFDNPRNAPVSMPPVSTHTVKR